MSYGKRCVKCQVYFVSNRPDDRLCARCSRLLTGRGISTLLLTE